MNRCMALSFFLDASYRIVGKPAVPRSITPLTAEPAWKVPHEFPRKIKAEPSQARTVSWSNPEFPEGGIMAEGTTTQQIQSCLDDLRNGDEKALDKLFRYAYARLLDRAHHMLRDYPGVRLREKTGDVLNEASLRLLPALQVLKPATVKDFFGLAALHIRRRLIDLARHYKGKVAHAVSLENAGGSERLAPGLDVPAPESPSSSDRLELWAKFYEQVEILPVEEREVFDQLGVLGITQEEAAEVLGISLATLTRRWQKVRRKLASYRPE